MSQASGMDPQGLLIASMIGAASAAYAAGAVERQLDRQHDALIRFGIGGYEAFSRDTEERLRSLGESVAAGCPILFEDEVRWSKVFLCARGVGMEVLDLNLQCIGDELAERLPAGLGPVVARHVAAARAALERAPTKLPSLLATEGSMIDVARRYFLAVIEGKHGDAIDVVVDAQRAGAPVADIHEHVITRVQGELGRMWQMAEIYPGVEHLGTRIAEDALARLRGSTPWAPPSAPGVVAASVAGGRHDLAARMLADQFEREGWRAYLLGADTPVDDLHHLARDFKAGLVVLSVPMIANLRVAARQVSVLRESLNAAIVVGGHPFNVAADLWRIVGADGYGRTVQEGVQESLRLARGPDRSSALQP